jgi:hypothetical protein
VNKTQFYGNGKLVHGYNDIDMNSFIHGIQPNAEESWDE